ncbi:hypothetical protein [Gemmatimonas groenlandica]|uniref:TonB-dependent receptor n=1 Tax=Gemmatimonas groenlandica TaxID=2732249 RepID=A0A6M4INN2_9BACT|nr:hypothetical protein [Gemmatimonas groenlandica]QJR35538.1 hypothetical protein HKW67_08470 [Gemmatimonas groenlandica]
MTYARFGRLLVVIAATPFSLSSQPSVVKGIVLDSLRRGLADVSVDRIDGSAYALTRTDGRFSLLLDGTTSRVRFQKVGYLPAERTLNLAAFPHEILEVVLSVAPTALAGVLVSGGREGAAMTRESVRRIPPVGESDVYRALPLLAGVTQPDDVKARVNLLGAAGDEASYSLDGHPLQAMAHLQNVIGAFNTASIDGVELRLNQIPSVVDSRVGGLVAVTTRQPGRERNGELVASLLSLGATVVSASSTRADLLVSARASYIGALLNRVTDGSGSSSARVPDFSDALVRFGFTPTPSSRVELLGSRAFDAERPGPGSTGVPLRSSETLGGLRLTFAGKRMDAHLRTSHDRAETLDRNQVAGVAAVNNVQSWFSAEAGAKLQLWRVLEASGVVSLDERRHMHRWLNIRTGAGGSERLDLSARQRLLAVGSQFLLKFSEGRSLSAGARITVADSSSAFAPQLVAKVLSSSAQQVSIGIERRAQFDAQLSDPENTRPQPTFLLSRPRLMDAVSLEYRLHERTDGGVAYSLHTTAAVRWYADRTTSAQRSGPAASRTSDMLFERAPARSLGIATTVLARHASGPSAQLTYSFVRSLTRRHDEWVPTSWDTPSNISGVFTLPLPRRLSLSVVGAMRSGLPITPIVGRVIVPSFDGSGGESRLIYGEMNSARLPGFQRFDVALRKRWTPRAFEVDASLQVVNLLYKRNVVAYDAATYLAQVASGQTPTARRAGLPLVPSIGVEVRW